VSGHLCPTQACAQSHQKGTQTHYVTEHDKGQDNATTQ
jgi:hypothetical protein